MIIDRNIPGKAYKQMTIQPAWLKDAIFYEIYPQSFHDSNSDGIGDIVGIIEKLDYLQELGVNAIWINPCFDSPFQDAGYDVRDYYQVAARYGKNEDLVNLFNEGKKRGIRILLDLVPGHTSIEHPWFQQSSKHEHNPYSDWYIWTDSAWKWEVPGFRIISGMAEKDSSYVTNFFYFQPALNYGYFNPDPSQPWQQPVDAPGPQAVRSEIRKIMKFWLDLGASGFRVDMAGSLVKNDPEFKGTISFWNDIRAWLDQNYPDACIISEWGKPTLAIKAGFHADFCLPFGMTGYTALFRKQYGPGAGSDPYGESFFSSSGHGNIVEFVDDYSAHYNNTRGKGIVIIPSGNHDINPRISEGRTEQDLMVLFTFLMTMPGAPIIYYGDEIGMRSIQGLPSKEGGYNRTASRTPMQWNEDVNAGFSKAPTSHLYLPTDPDASRPCAEDHINRPNSLWRHIQNMIKFRKENPALSADSEFNVIHAERFDYPFVFLRRSTSQSLLIAVNPSSTPRSCKVSLKVTAGNLLNGSASILPAGPNEWIINIPGVSAGIFALEDYIE